MHKKTLVARAARRSNLTQAQVRQALDDLLETIAQALVAGETVALADFGRFEMQAYRGRKLRRFDGDGHYDVQARAIPVFKSSAALRRRVRGER